MLQGSALGGPATERPAPLWSEASAGAEWEDAGPTVTGTADSLPRGKRKPLRVPVEEPVAPTEDPHLMVTAISRLADIEQGSTRLVISARLREQARTLGAHLPENVLHRNARDSLEEAVLRAALRIGLASLASLADVEEDFEG